MSLLAEDIKYGRSLDSSSDLFWRESKTVSGSFPLEKITGVWTFVTKSEVFIHGYLSPVGGWAGHEGLGVKNDFLSYMTPNWF